MKRAFLVPLGAAVAALAPAGALARTASHQVAETRVAVQRVVAHESIRDRLARPLLALPRQLAAVAQAAGHISHISHASHASHASHSSHASHASHASHFSSG